VRKIGSVLNIAGLRVVCIAASILVPLLSSQGASAANPCGDVKAASLRKAALRKEAQHTLVAIQKRDVGDLLSSFSSRGVGFGVDQPFTPLNEIKAQMTLRRGAYCLFFSTECLLSDETTRGFRADKVLSQWKISYAEWLNRNKGYQLEEDLLDSDGTDFCGGLVTIRGQRKIEQAPNVLELQFINEGGRWMLVNTPFGSGD
jgi:hypothetical protein